MIKLIGPATITHNGVDIGKTKGGGSINLLETSYEPLANFYKVEHILYGVEGQINLFQLDSSVTLSSTRVLFDYGEVIISLKYGTITLFNTRLLYPKDISFGTFDQNPFTLLIEGGEDGSGNIIKFE